LLAFGELRERVWHCIDTVEARQETEDPTETVGNALEAECYSEASSAAFDSLFFISITSSINRAGDGIEPVKSRLGNLTSIENNGNSVSDHFWSKKFTVRPKQAL
jgi:hypothetical protein